MGEITKATFDRLPSPGEVVVAVTYTAADDPNGVHITFEPERRFYARQLVARPRMLFSFARKVAWLNFKLVLKGKPRPIATVADRIGDES